MPGQAPVPPADNQRTEDPCSETASPVVITSGNKVLDETDFATANGLFVFTRTYTRQGGGSGLGDHWRHSFAYTMSGTPRPGWGNCTGGFPPGEACPLGNRYTAIVLHRPDGVSYRYVWNHAMQYYMDSRPESTSWIAEEEIWKDEHGNYFPETGTFIVHHEDGSTERTTAPERFAPSPTSEAPITRSRTMRPGT